MSLSEIGHARAGRGRLFTWPSSEHSQVPLAHITSRYSCHQALASGAERVRVTEQRQSETERNETGTNDRNKAKSQRGGGGDAEVCRSFAFVALIYTYATFSTRWPSHITLLQPVQAISPTSPRTSSETRSQSLVLVWKLRPHADSTSVETHKPHSACCFHLAHIGYKGEKKMLILWIG